MRKILICSFLLFLISACKKESHLSEIQYKIVNNGDSLVSSFAIWTNTYLDGDPSKTVHHDQVFTGIKPFDTITLKIYGLEENSVDFRRAVRNFKFRVGFKKKVFSQYYFDNHYLEPGEPSGYGWTWQLHFTQKSVDTVNKISDKVFYINWPTDSSKLNLVTDF